MAAINYNFPLDPNGHSESELVTALYLYGDKVTVQNGNVIIPKDEELLDSSLIREELVVPAGTTNPNNINIDIIEVEVDEVDYMTNGPGRFANGYQFDLVKAFFGETAAAMKSKNGRKNYLLDSSKLNSFGTPTYDNQGNLISRTYTKDDIDEIYFQDQLGGFSANLELRDYDDGTDNFNQRIYTWNSQQYSLPDSVEFVINYDAAGNETGREIKNFHIDPNVRTNYDFKENFDFDTANPIVEAASKLLLEPRVDPSGIGRTVYFDFVNRDSPQDSSYLYDPIDTGNSSGTYDRDDFNQDSIKELNSFLNDPFPISAANAGVRSIAEANKVFDLGVTEFLYKDKPLWYGTVNNDNLKASDLETSNFPLQIGKAKNGVVLVGGQGNDTIKGDINSGVSPTDDILVGHEGNDSLNGGSREDVAIYFDTYTDANGNPNYDISTNTNTKVTTITHLNGGIDGTDTLKNVEFAQFQGGQQEPLAFIPSGGEDEFGNQSFVASESESAPRIIPLPLEDGVEKTESAQAVDNTANPNPNDPPTPPYVSLTAPVAMLDGDVDYTLNISPYKPDTNHNIVYIIDTSLSVDSTEFQVVKDAYLDLTNHFIDNELAENINFGVVSFDNQAFLQKDLTADEAISAIQGLTTATSIGTDYDAGLWQGVNFLTTSPLRPSFPVSPDSSSTFDNPDGTTSIGYFFSDGQNSSDRFTMLDTAKTLRRYSNVQAFGVGASDTLMERDINFIDSNDGVMMSSSSDLSTELQKSGYDDSVVEVNILVDGVVVDTIQPSQLIDSPLGLTYEGSVDELDVSIDAENIVTAEVVFTPESNLATASVDVTVTAGEGKLTDGDGNPIDETGNNPGDEDPFEKERNGGDGDDDITIGYADLGANGGAGGDYIVGNKRDNILNGGAGDDTIIGHEGNDTITTGAGNDKVDGGEGIDTALYGDVVYEGNNSIYLKQVGNTVIYNGTDLLTDVEYLQFSDVRISAATLEVTPVIEVEELSIAEGDSGNTIAQLTFNLDTPAPVDVVFDYSTEDINAVAGTDYTATSGQITIPAGEVAATLDLEVIGDDDDEGIESFSLNLSALSGATFINNETEYSTVATIENDDEIEPLVLNGDENDNRIEGDALSDFISGGLGNDTLKGLAGDDNLLGGEGDDLLSGDLGNDTLYGEAGKDKLYAKEGNDLLDGGDGDDFFSGHAGNDTIYGGFGNDSINGGANKDLLNGENGHDTLNGNEDQDTLVGDAGDDSLNGGTENDVLNGAEGNDILDGGDGNDKLYGKVGDDFLLGGAGNDYFSGHADNDTIIGGDGDDTFNGGGGVDTVVESTSTSFTLTDNQLIGRGSDSLSQIELVQLDGNDTNNLIDAGNVTQLNVILNGHGGKDTLKGGEGDDAIDGGIDIDLLSGGEGKDTLDGGDGNDKLYGKVGQDLLMGSKGDDYFSGHADNDTIIGGDGDDTIIGGGGVDTVVESTSTSFTLTDNQLIGRGNDSLSQIELVQLDGNETGNLIDASSVTQLNVTLNGHGGNDLLSGGKGTDTLDGGDSNDKLYGKEGNDLLQGGAGNDYFSGHAGDDTLYGGDGIDSLNGGGNDDLLKGGLGDDILSGNSGSDVFVLESASGTDTINDFSDGVDSLGLTASLGFSDLSITDNAVGTATLIADTTRGNQILAIVPNVNAVDITAEDFTDI